MSFPSSTEIPRDVARLSTRAREWWDPHGAFAALHAMAAVRETYVFDLIDRTFPKRRPESLHVLDVGCGGGLMAEAMAAAGFSVTGIDVSAQAVKVAKAHAARSGQIIDYRTQKPEECALSNERFDVVLALEVIEHVQNIETFMASLVRLLKPNGLLIIATMNRTVRSYLFGIIGAEYLLKWIPEGLHDWNAFIKPSEIAAMWRMRGIKPVDVTGIVFDPAQGRFTLQKRKTAINYFMAGRLSGKGTFLLP